MNNIRVKSYSHVEILVCVLCAWGKIIFKTNKGIMLREKKNQNIPEYGRRYWLLVSAWEMVGQNPESVICAKSFKFSCSKLDYEPLSSYISNVVAHSAWVYSCHTWSTMKYRNNYDIDHLEILSRHSQWINLNDFGDLPWPSESSGSK